MAFSYNLVNPISFPLPQNDCIHITSTVHLQIDFEFVLTIWFVTSFWALSTLSVSAWRPGGSGSGSWTSRCWRRTRCPSSPPRAPKSWDKSSKISGNSEKSVFGESRRSIPALRWFRGPRRSWSGRRSRIPERVPAEPGRCWHPDLEFLVRGSKKSFRGEIWTEHVWVLFLFSPFQITSI